MGRQDCGHRLQDGDKLRYSGFITSDSEVLRAFDGDAVEDERKSALYPFKASVDKDGRIKIIGSGGHVAEDNRLVEFCDYARKIAGASAGEIASGYIQPSPTGKACEYCKYGALCNRRDVKPRDTGRYELVDSEGADNGLE